MHCFNHHGLLEPIGYIPPAEVEVNDYRQIAEKAEPLFHFNQPAATKTEAFE